MDNSEEAINERFLNNIHDVIIFNGEDRIKVKQIKYIIDVWLKSKEGE